MNPADQTHNDYTITLTKAQAAAEDFWAETEDWRTTVEDIVEAALQRVSVLEMHKALASQPAIA